MRRSGVRLPKAAPEVRANIDLEHDALEPVERRKGRMVPASSAVMNVVVQVAEIVPERLDLAHVGTPEQQLGMSLGSVLVYLRTAGTARTIADGWSRATVLARPLSPAIVGRRPLAAGPSTVAAMVQMAGVPQVTAEFEPARFGGAVPAMLRVQVGRSRGGFATRRRTTRCSARGGRPLGCWARTRRRTSSNHRLWTTRGGRWRGRPEPRHDRRRGQVLDRRCTARRRRERADPR